MPIRWRKALLRYGRHPVDDLRAAYALDPLLKNFGWSHEAAALRRSPAPRDAGDICKRIIAAAAGRSVVLWPFLFRAWPNWHWGLQGTGDCVSWGTGHMGDVTMAIQFLAGRIRRPEALVCQESIYGFGKAELYDSYGWHGQGMAGYDGVESWKKFGTLYRKSYPNYDLTDYSGSRAKTWGETPRSTHGVPDALEAFAAAHLAKDYANVTDGQAAAALLESGIAVQYCGISYWPLGRDSQGMGTNVTRGSHCMTLVGVMYDDAGKPEFGRIANVGHGDHVSGPAEISLPQVGVPPEVYQECGGWISWSRYIEPILRAGDCYAITFVEGWEPINLASLGTGAYL